MPGRGELTPMSPKQKKKLKEFVEKNRDLKKPKLAMIDVRAKMAMPKMVDSSNFPKMAQDMAMAMDYNSSKPRMDYGAKLYVDSKKKKKK